MRCVRVWWDWSNVLNQVPFFRRLSTRLTALILVVVAVLAGAAITLLARGFSLYQDGLLNPDAAGSADLDAIIRGTVINLLAVFLFTLVAATIFSRSFLTEPIEQLAQGVREVQEGNLEVTLPVKSTSELGELARSFNVMSERLAARTRDLTESNEALRASEQRYAEALELTEQHVHERTLELRALLELSNSTALTLDLHPMLDRILERLHEAVPHDGAAVLELNPGGRLKPVVQHGRHEGLQLSLPLVVRDQKLGRLVLFRNDGTGFDEGQRSIASAFANQVAIALENDNLYEQVHERAAYEERQHLARELHDSVSQALYGILLGAHTAQKQIDVAPEKAASALNYVENLAQAALAEMRALIFELRPEALEQDGLVGAMRKQLDALETRHELNAHGELGLEPDMPLATKQVVYRIAQEAIHNIVKHAQASHVWVSLGPTDGGYRLVVRDDGHGFEPDQEFTNRLGLKSMRERAAALGGTLEINSTEGEGTIVELNLPRPEQLAGLEMELDA